MADVSDLIDFDTRVREREARRDRRFARRLLTQTMHLRYRIPKIPRYGVAAAALLQEGPDLVLVIAPDLDDVDVKIVAYGFARRFERIERFEGVDVIHRSTLRTVRAKLMKAAHPERILERMVGA